MANSRAAKNTDKEIWRKVKDDYFSPSIHVTRSGSIGIDVGGFVIVAPVEEWHEAMQKERLRKRPCHDVEEYYKEEESEEK